MIHDLYLKFADKAEALKVINYLLEIADELDELPPDGRYLQAKYNLVDCGQVYDGETPLTGYHVICRWRGDTPVPKELIAYEVNAWGQSLGDIKPQDGLGEYIKTKSERISSLKLVESSITKLDIAKLPIKEVVKDVVSEGSAKP
jgi:hypothetical protein